MVAASEPLDGVDAGFGEISVLVSAVHRRAAIDGVEHPSALAELARSFAPWASEPVLASVVAAVRRRLLGLGEIESLLGEPTVSDVLINGPGPVLVERDGSLEVSSVVLDADGVRLLVDRISALTRRRPDVRSPVIESSLPSGHRVTVVVAPVAVRGPVVAIRRRRTDLAGIGSFVEARSGLIGQLLELVGEGSSILVAGVTGAGKTTLIGSLLDAVDPRERVVVIEDVAEIVTSHGDVARLVARDDGINPTVGLGDLVRVALRLRPDRIVVGEVRGAEATHLVHALSTGHRGGLASIHAGDAHAAAARLTSLYRAGVDGPLDDAGIDQLSRAFDKVVVLGRCPDGRRAIVDVADFRLGFRR